VGLLACAITLVNGDAYAICVFQDTNHVKGYLTFQQEFVGGDTGVIANFTAINHKTRLYLHIHTDGDLNLDPDVPSDNSCFTNVTLGPYTGAYKPYHFLSTSWVSGLDLFGANSIVGRSLHLYSKQRYCPQAVSKKIQPMGSCVIGLRNVAAIAENFGNTILPELPVSAFAKFTGASNNSQIVGRAFFVPTTNNEVYVYIKVLGLAPSQFHAFHIHEWGDISNPQGLSAGSHLNPYNEKHGLPGSDERHMGDLGNLWANDHGKAVWEGTFDLLSLNSSTANIIGRAVVIHALVDDGNPTNATNSTGAAGARVAIAVIGISARLPDLYSQDDMYARLAIRAQAQAQALAVTPVAVTPSAVVAAAAATPIVAAKTSSKTAVKTPAKRLHAAVKGSLQA